MLKFIKNKSKICKELTLTHTEWVGGMFTCIETDVISFYIQTLNWESGRK